MGSKYAIKQTRSFSVQPPNTRKCSLVFELTQSNKCVARYTTEATITSSCCPSFLDAAKAWAAKIVGASNLHLFTIGYKLYQPTTTFGHSDEN